MDQASSDALSSGRELDFSAASNPLDSERALAHRIRTSILDQAWLVDLCVDVTSEHVRLEGRALSFYGRQLAQQTALRLKGDRRLDDRIEVSVRPK